MALPASSPLGNKIINMIDYFFCFVKKIVPMMLLPAFLQECFANVKMTWWEKKSFDDTDTWQPGSCSWPEREKVND